MQTLQANQTDALLSGLSEAEVQARRSRGMGNGPPPPTGRTYWEIISENAFNFINLTLLGLGLALVLLGRLGDALVSTGIILLNVLVSVVQEIRAKQMLDRIALMNSPTAAVLRDGREISIAPEQLVIGDVLALRAGDQVIVDGRVVGPGRAMVDESQLTGESNLVPKQAGDQVFSGSFCVSGAIFYEAEQVGAQSFANRLVAGARAFRRILTPLQREIHLVIRITMLLVVYLEFLNAFRALLEQQDLVGAVQNSTMIAGLVPNGLFVSISIAYALAAVRIARFGALVQQSNAIESLSNVDTLCLDKTGTLTTNRLQLHGLHPIGTTEAALRDTLGVMTASSAGGNKTSAAIAAACPGERRALLAEVPFASDRKWSAVAFQPAPAGPQGIIALGAPEMLHPFVSTETDWPAITATTSELAEHGLRVLLVVQHPDPTLLADHGPDSRLPEGMGVLGLVSLSDELRPEAQQTLAAFERTGVRLKIISGDNPETVAALARQAGMSPTLRLISGPELEGMDEGRFAEAAQNGTIFGRITPHQKERLVRALRAQGRYVAMIGDGVNDVLSLKQANLAIAMQSGSQAARSVADIVLLNDNFAVLPHAVEEGQRILNGMQDILKLYLTRLLTVGLLIVSALVIGEFPLALRQGSAVVLFSVGVPTILLAFWARPGPIPKGNMLQRLFHFVVPPVLTTSVIGLILFYGTLLLLFNQVVGDTMPPAEQVRQIYAAVMPTAQTILTTFLVFCGLFLVIFCEPPTAWWTGGDRLSPDRRPLILACILMALFIVILVVPPLSAIFALATLTWQDMGLVALALLIWLPLVRWLWRINLLGRFLAVDIQSHAA